MVLSKREIPQCRLADVNAGKRSDGTGMQAQAPALSIQHTPAHRMTWRSSFKYTSTLRFMKSVCRGDCAKRRWGGLVELAGTWNKLGPTDRAT
jgi:hypothetical protein